MASFICLTTLLLSSLVSFASALPNVTATPIPGCSAYPSYDPTTDTTGWFFFTAYQTDNSSVDGLGTDQEFSRGANQIRWGSITLGTRPDEAKVAMRCSNNTLTGFVSTGVSGATWETLQFAPYPYDAELMYFVEGGPVAEAHELTLDGVKQDGVFIGSNGVATWGFRYFDASYSCCGVPFYQLRLLGPNSADPTTGAALQDGEFQGFLKITAA